MSDGTGLFNSEIKSHLRGNFKSQPNFAGLLKLPPEIKNISVFFLTNNVLTCIVNLVNLVWSISPCPLILLK